MPIALILLGVAAGVLSGMFGIGGGVVIVPVLMTFYAFAPQQAVGTSLAALLMPVGIFAVIEYYRKGKLKPMFAALVAFGLLLGVYFGARIALGLPADTLQRIYGAFLIYAGWRFVEPRKWYADLRARKPTAPDAVTPDTKITPALGASLVVLGFIAGIASGMFGIGGGLVIVPFLVSLFKFDQKVAVGTSLGALLLPVGLPGVLAYYAENQLDLSSAFFVAIGLIGGALLGARIALNLPSATVKRLYGIFLLVIAFRFIFGV